MTRTVALHHQLGGPEQGVPLVVLHGLFGSADNWRSHARQWQAQRRVVVVDLRNHGRSPHAATMNYAVMAEDVVALLDQLGIERCDLLGHSMGGKVALSVARLYPQRLASLIVADIAPVAYDHGHETIFGAMRQGERDAPESRKQADSAMAAHVETPAIRRFLATNLERGDDGIMRWRVGLDEIEAAYADIAAEPAGEGSYSGPTLVVRGSRSDYVEDALLPQVKAVLPAAQVVTLEAGHWLHAEAPKAFHEAVDTFLAERGHEEN